MTDWGLFLGKGEGFFYEGSSPTLILLHIINNIPSSLIII